MKKAWLLRPVPHGITRINEFLTKKIVAIGWPNIGNLSGTSREGLKLRLSQPPYQLSSLELGNAYATVDIFVNQMNIGDLILMPNGTDIHFGIIESDYIFDENCEEEGYSHQRVVKWLSLTQRNDLPMQLRSSLRVHRTTADLSTHYNFIEALAYGTPLLPLLKEDTSDFVTASYPLRTDLVVTISIPKNINKAEAERLSDFVKTLYFQQ